MLLKNVKSFDLRNNQIFLYNKFINLREALKSVELFTAADQILLCLKLCLKSISGHSE